MSQEAFDAFYDEKWAIFPTVPYLKKAIAELENFLVESGGRVTAGGVNEKIRSLRSGPKSDFTLLMKKGHELTGISESFTPHLSLSLDPDGVWGLDEGRYERIVQSWGPDCQFFKVRHHFRLRKFSSVNHTNIAGGRLPGQSSKVVG